MSSLIQGYQIAVPFELTGSGGSFLFSGSRVEINSTTSSTDFFIIKQNGQQIFKVNQEGVVEHKMLTTTPTVVTGGLFYSSSDDWYLSYRNV
jgi:hypothetical protein